jgi:hypothetical protein
MNKAQSRHLKFSASLSGCHFHFSSAIYKKLSELGLKTAYGNKLDSSNY